MIARALPRSSLAGEVWRLAWPAITHMLLVTLGFVLDRAMLGRSSSAALASMQISGTVVWSIYSVLTAFSAGTLAVVARSVGAGDRLGAAAAARASLALAFVLGLAVMVPLLAGRGALLFAVFPKTPDDVQADALAYLGIVLPAMPLSFVEAISAATLQASGDTRTPLVIGGTGVVVKTALSAVLVFGAFGAPRLGVRGAAIGTAVALSLEGVLLIAALLSPRSPLAIAARAPDEAALGAMARARKDLAALRRVLDISGPAFAEKVFYQIGYLGFTAVIGLLGEIAMASNQALVSIESVCFLSADGFAIAAGALVAQKLGAERPDDASRAGLYATAMAVALLGTFGLVFAAVPGLLVEAFSPDPRVVATGARALYVAAVAQPFMATAVVLAMSLRGAGDTRTVLAVTFVAALLVRVAASYFFAIVLGLGLVGVWMGSTADWMTRTALLGAAWARGRWRAARV